MEDINFFNTKESPKISMELMDRVIKQMFKENPDVESIDMGDIIDRCIEDMKYMKRELN